MEINNVVIRVVLRLVPHVVLRVVRLVVLHVVLRVVRLVVQRVVLRAVSRFDGKLCALNENGYQSWAHEHRF